MYDQKLKFNKDGSFKIMFLGDVHEKADISSPLAQKKVADTYLLINTALDRLSPDLVVLGGDIFTNREQEEPFADFRAGIARVSRPMRERGIPYAVILGNHDHDGYLQDKQVAMYDELEYCIIGNEDANITGNANYHRLIYSSDGERPVANLWFIDSNNCCPDRSISKYDWVHKDQIEWYERTAAALKAENGGKPLPAICFQHIPVMEEYELLRPAKRRERYRAVQGHGKKSDKFYVLKNGVKGWLGEGPCTPDRDDGQFESWKRTGDVFAAFFGHDHLNDFQGEVDGILLAQSKTAGFRVYTDGCRAGVRMITLNEDNPRRLQTRMHHFKSFGLKCTSLGFFQRNFNDRQSENLEKAVRAITKPFRRKKEKQ